MASTVAKLEQEMMTLRQVINGLTMTVDSHWATYQADRLAMQREIKEYLQSGLKPQQQEEHKPELRAEPWRLPLEDFLSWREGIKQDWSDNGNSRVGQRLARNLKRSSGHAEGQLYIDWCGKVGRPAVKAWWISRGFKEVPEGL